MDIIDEGVLIQRCYSLVTVNNLSPGKSLPGSMVVEVTDVNWNAGKARRAEVELIDTARNELRLIDYDGADLSVHWKPQDRYRISQCSVHKGGQEFEVELAPSTRTEIESLGQTAKSTRLLVIGDTHIGRTEHPRTGETIDPLGAFISATQSAIELDVDAVVHVGDIFHDNATPLKAKLAKQEAFDPGWGRTVQASIPYRTGREWSWQTERARCARVQYSRLGGPYSSEARISRRATAIAPRAFEVHAPGSRLSPVRDRA